MVPEQASSQYQGYCQSLVPHNGMEFVNKSVLMCAEIRNRWADYLHPPTVLPV